MFIRFWVKIPSFLWSDFRWAKRFDLGGGWFFIIGDFRFFPEFKDREGVVLYYPPTD